MVHIVQYCVEIEIDQFDEFFSVSTDQPAMIMWKVPSMFYFFDEGYCHTDSYWRRFVEGRGSGPTNLTTTHRGKVEKIVHWIRNIWLIVYI